MGAALGSLSDSPASRRGRLAAVNLLDWLLILLTIAYGVSGYWQGFVTGAAATGGLLIGGLLGIVVIPHLLGGLEPSVGVSLMAHVTRLVTPADVHGRGP